MKRRIICCLLAAMLFIGSLPAAQAASAPKVSVQTVSATAGDEVSVTVSLSGNTGFSDLSIALDYDPAVLTLAHAEQEALTSRCLKSQDLTDRPYSLIWVSATSLCESNGILATLTFRISEDAPGGDTPVCVGFYKGRQGNYEDGINVNYRMDSEQEQKPLGLTYSSGFVRVEALPDTEVTVSLDGCGQATLSARHAMTGQIYAASYTSEGRMLDVSIRDAASTVNASPASGAAYVKLMWLDDGRPVCAALDVTAAAPIVKKKLTA